MSGNNAAREFMDKLVEVERTIFDLHQSLETLRQDVVAIDDGWNFNLVIDYHELHRFLHPCVDENRDDREKFYLGQLVLNYLFDVSKEKLLLLPTYVDEFKARIRKISSDLKALHSREYSTKRQRELAKFIEKLSEGKAIPDTAAELIRKYALDVLTTGSVEIGMRRAMDRYVDMVRKGKIYFAEQIKDFDPLFPIEDDSEEFKQIWAEMIKHRPQIEKFQPNVTDTKAAAWVKRANKLNFSKKQAFVLLSSSRGIKPAFRTVPLPLTKEGNIFQSTILRDIPYILFRYYFCVNERSAEEIIEQIYQTQELFREYIKRMEELHKKAVEITVKEIDQTSILPLYKQVLDRIWEFETLMTQKTDFRPVQPLSDQETLKEIIDIAQNEEVLRESIEYALNALEKSIETIDEIYREIVEICQRNTRSG